MNEKKNSNRLLVEKALGRIPLGSPRRGRVDSIQMDLIEIEWGDVNWIGLVLERGSLRAPVNAVLNFWVP
jgi:hypothetical protein